MLAIKKIIIFICLLQTIIVMRGQSSYKTNVSINANNKNIDVGDGYYFKGYSNLKMEIGFNIAKTDNKLCIIDYSCSAIILGTGPMVFEDPQGKVILINNTQKISNINFIIDFDPAKSAAGLHSISFQNVSLQTGIQSIVYDKHVSLQQNACNTTINTSDIFYNVKLFSFSFSNIDLDALKKIISPYKPQKKSEDDFWNSDKSSNKETTSKQNQKTTSKNNSNSIAVPENKKSSSSFNTNANTGNNQSFYKEYLDKSNAEIEKKRNEHKQQQEEALKKIIFKDYQKQSETNYQNMTDYVNQMTNAMLAYDKEKRRKEEERDRIEHEKKQAEQKKIESEKQLITNFNNYVYGLKVGHTPKPSQILEQDFVYIFFYYPLVNGAYDLNVYISNIVKVYKQSDGTWPYEIDIKNKVNSFNNKTNAMQGYYLNYNEAVMAQNNIVTNAKNYYAIIKTYDLSTLFIEKTTDNANESNTNKTVPGDKKDFWND